MTLPSRFHALFWDCRPDALDTEAHAPFILERVLEYGSLTAVRWALETYGGPRIERFLRERGVRTLSRKTLSLWTVLLGLEADPCFARSSLKASRTFWDY